MCASIGSGNSEKIEALIPPGGCQPGDPVYISGFERDPIEEIHPKRSQWDKVKDKVTTDADGIAVFDGNNAWKTDKGYVTSGLLSATIS